MKRILFSIGLIAITLSAHASHIVGGDVYYNYLGNNKYKFFFNVYRDCYSTGAAYDNPLHVAVYTQNGATVQNLSIPFPGSVILPVNFNNPCVIPPTTICVEKAVYTVDITLPPIAGGYTVTYQRCCRNPNISNIISPDDTGLTWSAHVPGSETGFSVNSSPRFTNYPPLLLCNNEQLIFDHSATDPDGDQLFYSLVTPSSGASSSMPLPNPPPPPPYNSVNWGSGFGATNPLGSGANISINSTTGLLLASPLMTGLFVVGIRVQEYRNGILVGETVRDFLFTVFNCNITMSAILPLQTQLSTFVSYCQGLTVQFENNSFGGTNYAWDFGVPGTNTDVSTQFAPTFTYPANGTYTAQLIVNPGKPCTDTAKMVVTVNNSIQVSFNAQNPQCISGNSFNFVGTCNNQSPATFNWNFSPNAIPTTANTLSVNNVSFSAAGYIPVTLNAISGVCTSSYTDSVYIYPMPNAVIDVPAKIECNGLTIPFGNSSTSALKYNWDFGVPVISTDTSTLATPTYTFPAPGVYVVNLIASTFGLCVDTATVSIKLNELLAVSFTNNDSLCITGNSFNFDGQLSGPPTSQVVWDFGPHAVPSTSTSVDVNGVVFDTSGVLKVKLTGTFENCLDSAVRTIFIYREPTIDFKAEPGVRCAPNVVQFTSLCTSDSPLTYTWNFGDGSTSSAVNPSHLYTSPNVYTVGLTIHAAVGCTDTLKLVKNNFIEMYPSPVSKFSINPKITDICHSSITFTNQATGFSAIYYSFGEKGANSSQPNVIYTYQTEGSHRPMQLAINEYGCRDSSFNEVYIEPFTLYFPNTFTPDQDEFNNTFNASFSLTVNYWDFKVYNRWGDLIFESFNPAIGWDGSYGNKMMQDGIYTYRLKYSPCNSPDEIRLLTGHIGLLR